MGALEPCRPPDTPVFQDETDARQHLLGLFGAERMKSVVGSCLRLGQKDFAGLVRLQANDPAAFSREYGAADDLLAWAQQVKGLADQIFIRVAVAKTDWD